MKLIKIITAILFISSLTSIIIGYFTTLQYSQKLIGFGVLVLFLVVFPLFSYYRWKDKNVKDYMLSKENLDSMRQYQNPKKQ